MRKLLQTLMVAGVSLAVVPSLAYAQASTGADSGSAGGVSSGADRGGPGGVSTGSNATGGTAGPGGTRQGDSDASGTTGDLSRRSPLTRSQSDQQDVPVVPAPGARTTTGQGRMMAPGAQGQGDMRQGDMRQGDVRQGDMRQGDMRQGGTANMGFDTTAGASREYVPLPRGAAKGRPCFAQAWDFDQKLKMAMKPDQPQVGQFPEATQMRNQGMEACNAGRVQEGQRMIRDAAQRLGS